MLRYLLSVLFLFILFAALSLTGSAQDSRASVSASEVNGTFQMDFKGKYKGNSNQVKILALGGGKVRVAMSLVFPYTLPNGELMANTGELEGQARISGDTAVYRSDDLPGCVLTLQFKKAGLLDVEQEGDCGFGHNVRASGAYKKVSSMKPKFDDPE